MQIRFHDECFDTEILPPEIQGGVAYLHTGYAETWTPSNQSYDCNPIYYHLELINTDAARPYTDFAFDNDLTLRGFPERREMTGLYLF